MAPTSDPRGCNCGMARAAIIPPPPCPVHGAPQTARQRVPDMWQPFGSPLARQIEKAREFADIMQGHAFPCGWAERDAII